MPIFHSAIGDNSSRFAFTLIELLVVIAIVAVLAVVVVLTLNPAGLLREARDSNRLSDLATLNSALNLFLADQPGGNLGSVQTTFLSVADKTATSSAGDQCQGLGLTAPPLGSYFCSATSTSRNADGTGWIPVNLTGISFGTPLALLPRDPVNQTSSGLFYTYQTNGTQYEVTAMAESQKYLSLPLSIVGYPGVMVQGSNLTLSQLYAFFVQTRSNTVLGSTVMSLAFNYKTKPGNTLMVGIGTDNGTDILSSVSDSQGNTYALATKSAPLVQYLYYAISTIGGADTITVTVTTPTVIYLVVSEYAGLLASAPLDASFNTNVNTATVGPLTTASSSELLVGLTNTNTNVGAGPGFTKRTATVYNSYVTTFDDAPTLTSPPGAYSMTPLTNFSTLRAGILSAFRVIQ